jgi:hypothetical protein
MPVGGGKKLFSSTGDLIHLVSLRVSERERFRSAGSILFAHTEFPESVMRETFRGKLKFHRETFIFERERERERERTRESFHAFASEWCKQAKLFAKISKFLHE